MLQLCFRFEETLMSVWNASPPGSCFFCWSLAFSFLFQCYRWRAMSSTQHILIKLIYSPGAASLSLDFPTNVEDLKICALQITTQCLKYVKWQLHCIALHSINLNVILKSILLCNLNKQKSFKIFLERVIYFSRIYQLI